MRTIVSIAALMMLALLAAPALADDVAAADAAFKAGKALAKEGKYKQACAKFEESQRLAPGSGTLLNLADCYEHLGRTATAWATFRSAAAAASIKGKKERVEEARARATALEARLSKLRVVVPQPITGMQVRRGDTVIDATDYNQAIAVDPGTYVITARAPGHEQWSKTITVPPQPGSMDVTVPPLEPLQTEPPAPTPIPVFPPPPTPAPTPQPAATGAGDLQRTFGWVVGAVGVAALGVGIGLGIDAIAKKDQSNAEGGCDDNLCPPDGLELRDEALTEAHLSTGFFIGGLTFAAVGVVLILTAPDDEPAVGVAVTPTSLVLRGSF